ncbi:MAG: hypothetical protein ACJ74H_19260 [Thermoanaerobaculia bacterium]
MRILARLLLVLVLALNAAAQSTYEKVLVPVFFSGPGAHGSQWWTTVAIANDSNDRPIRFSQAVLEGDPSCAAVCGCGPSAEVRPRSVNSICIANAHPSGLLLYMEKNEANAHFGARVTDLSRSGDTAGTELKIVREHELRKGNIILPNIPIGPGYRVGLRVFDTLPFLNPEVILVIHSYPDLIPLLEETIPLNPPTDAGTPRPTHPAFVMIGDLAARYPQLRDNGLISIELLLPEATVSPVPAPSYWAVVTITNNVTQQVTMVTPQ